MMKRIFAGFLLSSILACLLASCNVITQKTYDFSTLTFQYPASWREMAETNSVYQIDPYFFSMHIFEDLTITSAQESGEPGVYFSVASLEHPYEGVEVYLDWMYGTLSDYTRGMSISPATINDFEATQYQYTRRLGAEGEAPWVQFRDIWVDSGPLIYLLSFYGEDLTGQQQAIKMIVESFKFKYHSAEYPGQLSPGVTFGAGGSN